MNNDKMEQSAENLVVDDAGQDRVYKLMNKVFDVDLLLDMILDYCIHNRGIKSFWRVLNCRLVSRAWLLSINRIFRKAKKPLFVFKLDKRQEIKPIDQFLNSVTGNHHLERLITPYAINGSATPIFSECLSKFGSALIQLNLHLKYKLPRQVSLMNNFLLPRLCKFSILLRSKSDPNEENNVLDMIKFIQAIFDASKQLESFTLFNGSSADNFDPANCFGSLRFPSSITRLDFRSPNDSQLEALVNSSLPNLKTLIFHVNHTPIKNGLITSVLERVKKTVETLHVHLKGCCNSQGWRRATSFQLPLMEKLKELYIDTRSFELEVRHSSTLRQQLAPVLKKVTLTHQTRSLLRKWTDIFCFSNVASLNVSMVYENIGEYEPSSPNFDLMTMQALYLAFPSVKELIMSPVNSSDMTALVFIMSEMKSLHCLRINVINEEELQSSDIWDAVLVGIPQEAVEALRESPDLWEGLQVRNDVSIRYLTELQTLEMTGGVGRNPKVCRFITEVAFQYAFLKMPKLTNLILKGGFRASLEMTTMWRHHIDPDLKALN